MKTKNPKQTKTNKVIKTFLFVGALGAFILYGINDQNSLADKYTISTASFEDKSGYEVSYINLTGKKTIEDRKIQLSEGFWTKGRLNF
jgi:hypothetical protein